MKNMGYRLINLFLLTLIFNIPGWAQETSVMIRVQAKDAKFIGTSIGGAKIIVREEITGEILAEGITEGSTGNTQVIMEQPRTRNGIVTDENTAGFLAKLKITEPVFVTIEAIAPINKKQASVRTTIQQWILPGKNILGDGIVLEIPGFVIDILSPQTHETIAGSNEVSISANVVLMCGCPITSGGMWNAENYEVNAIVSKRSGETRTIPLKIGSKVSTFSGKATFTPGNYEITVYAFDPATGNTGLDKTNIIIQ